MCVAAYAFVLLFSLLNTFSYKESVNICTYNIAFNCRRYSCYDNRSKFGILPEIYVNLVSTSLRTRKWPALLQSLLPSPRLKLKYAKSKIRYYDNSDATFNLLLLPLCGDIHLNPGPTRASSLTQPLVQWKEPNNGGDRHQTISGYSSTKINYSVDFLLSRQNYASILNTTTTDQIRCLGIMNRRLFRPRGRRAGDHVQRRAAIKRKIWDGHFGRFNEIHPNIIGNEQASWAIPVIVGQRHPDATLYNRRLNHPSLQYDVIANRPSLVRKITTPPPYRLLQGSNSPSELDPTPGALATELTAAVRKAISPHPTEPLTYYSLALQPPTTVTLHAGHRPVIVNNNKPKKSRSVDDPRCLRVIPLEDSRMPVVFLTNTNYILNKFDELHCLTILHKPSVLCINRN